LFGPDQTNKNPENATVMKDTKSTIIKKALDEESKKLSPMAREQIQNTRKKVGPLEHSWRKL
jgi:hypothetical protein